MESLIIFGILIFIGVLVFAFLLYRAYYNHKANQALKTGIPSRNVTPSNLILGLVIFSLILVNLIQYANQDHMMHRLNELYFQNHDIYNTLDGMEVNLSEQILNQTKTTYDDEFYYIDTIDNNLMFDLEFKIKTVYVSSTITVLVEDNEGTIAEYNVINEGLTHKVSLSLDIDKYYKIYLKQETNDLVDINIINEFNPYNELASRFEYLPLKVKYNGDMFEVRFYNNVNKFENSLEGLQVSNVELYYFNEETDFFETLSNVDFTESRDHEDEPYEIYATLTASNENEKDSISNVIVIITDNKGNVYDFYIEVDYTSRVID